MDSPAFFCKNWYNLCSFIDIKVQKSTKSHNCLMIFNIKNNVLKKGNDNLFVWHPNPLSNVIFDIKNGGLKLGVDLEWFPGSHAQGPRANWNKRFLPRAKTTTE